MQTLLSDGEKVFGRRVLPLMLRTRSVLRACRFATVLSKGFLQSLLQGKETPKAGEAMHPALRFQEIQTILPDLYPPVPLPERPRCCVRGDVQPRGHCAQPAQPLPPDELVDML